MQTNNKNMGVYLNRAVFILSIIGVLIALYVTQSFLRESPIVCVNNGCELVRKSVYSKILGVPIPAFGLLGYSLLVLFSFAKTTSNESKYLKAMLIIAIFGVSFVSWFTYTEIFKIKALCTWCVISAVNMVVILLLVLKITKTENSLTK